MWNNWIDRLKAKDSHTLPRFARYPMPLHAVVSSNMLETARPLAIVMGSPDFVAELLAIGSANLKEDVFVYFCGNNFLRNMIQTACTACNIQRSTKGLRQRFYFYYERFG